MSHDAADPQRLAPPALSALHAAAFEPPPPVARRSDMMRRRLRVFSGAFLLGLLVALVFNFGRSPIYQASARIQIMPAMPLAASDAGADPQGERQRFLLELQLLDSRPLLEQSVQRLQASGQLDGLSGDPVQAVQQMLSIEALANAPVALLQAEGPRAELTAGLLNTLIEVYRARQGLAGDAALQARLAEAREEASILEARVAQQRRALDAFRLQANIVSTEREENQALSRLKGLSAALNSVTEREAVASGRVQAIEQALAEDKRVPQARDHPTIAAIEARLSQNREEWRALERQYTPQYLELDPAARALKTRIANLEQQLEAERRTSQQSTLSEAREELRLARAAGQRLHQQLAADKQGAQTFSRQFAEYQSLQGELGGLEKLHQAAKQKLLALEAGESARRPRVQVLEPASVPREAWRPSYWRDAGIGLGAALLLGFVAVWFVEFFDRREPRPVGMPTMVIAPSWTGGAGHVAHVLPPAPEGLLLGHAVPLRELEPDEIAQLLSHAAPESRAMLACLLCGLSAAEVVALPLGAVDGAAGTLHLHGDWPRALPLPPLLRGWAARRAEQVAGSTAAPLFARANGQAIDVHDVRAAVATSALDAALAQPQAVTPEVLRHSYIAFLIRQGLRFGELASLVGRLPPEILNQLAVLAPGAPRLSRDEVEPLMPALRRATL